jgi:hypothetical protein
MPTGLKVAVQILDLWGFEVDEMADTLALSSEATERYRPTDSPEPEITEERTSCVSYILGIEKGLEIPFAGATDQATWKLWQPPGGILTDSFTVRLTFPSKSVQH